MRPMTRMIALLPLLAFLLFGCSSSAQLESSWRDTAPQVDGDLADWQDRLQPIEDLDMTLGIANDSEFFYVTLVTADRDLQAQILRQGLILWISGDGEKEKRLGVQYPVGVMADGSLTDRRDSMRRGAEMSPEDRARFLDEAADQQRGELKVLFAEESGSAWTMGVEELKGAEIGYGSGSSRFIYELKIPMRADHERPYALNCEPGAKIALCVQTPAVDMEALREQMQPRDGGMGGAGRGGRGGMGGGPPGGQDGMRAGRGGPPPLTVKSIDEWVEVQLVKVPAASDNTPGETLAAKEG